MRTIFLLLAGASLAVPDLSDRAIRREAAAIGRIAQAEPPLMALDTLLETAVAVQPYTPDSARRLYAQARTLAKTHPAIAWNPRLVKLWLALDPQSGEATLRALGTKPLEGLMSHYRDNPERSAAIARELLADPTTPPSAFTHALETIVVVEPADAARLLEQASRRPDLRGVAITASNVLSRLLRLAETNPDKIKPAIPPLQNLVQRDGFQDDGTTVPTASFQFDGRSIETADTRTTLVELIALLEKLTDPSARTAALKAARSLNMSFRNGPRSTVNRMIPPDAPLTEAVEQARGWDPPNQRLGLLWRYLIAKPRTEEEARPMIASYIRMALDAPADNDPFWFTQALLNLDGRLGPPGKQWVLPKSLRPDIFRAALRVGERAARQPEEYAALIAAMQKEQVAVPADIPSAQARVKLARLRSDLQTRYDFQLPALDGVTRTLKAERGKVVVLNFWATWCAPCRAEMPMLGRVYDSLRKTGLEMFAITDESADHIRQFTTKNAIPIPVLIDSNRRVFEHHRIRSLPQTVVLDRTGRVLAQFGEEVSEDQLRRAIQGK